MSIVNEYAGLADELVRYSRLCYDRRLVGAAGGNLSVRVPGRDAFLVTASGVSLRDVARENLVVVDRNGKTPGRAGGCQAIEGNRISSGRLCEADPRSPPSFTFTRPTPSHFHRVEQPIPTVTISAQLKLKQGPVVPPAPPGSKELRDFVAQAVEASPPEATVLLMEAHGLLAMRPTLCDAFDDAELAEDTAKIAYVEKPCGFAGRFPFPPACNWWI